MKRVRESTDVILEGERHVLEMIALGAALPDVLAALCRVIDDQSGLRSSIFLLDRTGKRLHLAAAPSLPDNWRERVASFPITQTACGAAITRHEQVISPDISIDPLFDGYHDVAAAAGVRAGWSTPFVSNDNRALGTFAVYSPVTGYPDAAHLRIVSRATHLASIAVERHQTDKTLRESERRFSTVFYAGPASMSVTRFADGRFMYVNDKFVTMFGYSREELIGKTAIGLGLWVDPAQRSHLWQSLGERRGVRDFETQARTKSGYLVDVIVWMERIQILGEECVLAIVCDIGERKRAEQALAYSERLLRVVLDALPIGVLVVNPAGDIVLSNPASRQIWSGLIPSGTERWTNSDAWWHATGEKLKPTDWPWARALARGESAINEIIEIEPADGTRKIVQHSAVPIRDASEHITGAVVVNEDVSARQAAERELHKSLTDLRTLTGRLMHAQDDERRRIAQMLHETTAQDLAVLKMHLARLQRSDASLSPDDRAALRESVDLAERSMAGIRTLSYLLHPPFLDEAGLLSAVRWYAAGFAERSGIKVELNLAPTLERQPRDVELALFRIVQEALINIHRHAESPLAVIDLRADGRELTLQIEDRGRGMPQELVAQMPNGLGSFGVGVVGMRERLKQLGGTLEIESSSGGTIVRARVPLAANTA